MKGWLLDAYRAGNKVVLWVKTRHDNIRLEFPFKVSLYLDLYARKFLDRNSIPYFVVEKLTYLRRWKKVCEVMIDDIMSYESFVKEVERRHRYSLALYNADVPPEQQFLYEHDLYPGCFIEVDGNKITKLEGSEITLSRCHVSVTTKARTVTSITVGDQKIEGDEHAVLERFARVFKELDPDVFLIDYAFSVVPMLDEKMRKYDIDCPFHRWDRARIEYKGGRPFFSYGQVHYKDFAVRLRGRFLVDSASAIGSECDVDGVLELCRLTGARFQHVASRSFGATFQHSLVKLMYQNGFLIPYKEKPVDIPLSMVDMLKGDRGGHTLDAKVGFHKGVAEIDFSSMFPWIIYNKNISADTILFDKGPFDKVPDIPIRVSHHHKGLVPLAVKPLLDRRMYYKNNPSATNKARAAGLKWVLVTAYGYLRFREFKLGIASSHMAICAYAREILIQSARLAESRGFKVVHGIIDSLYIKKKGMTKEEVESFCKELEQLVGIPISFEGLFKWVVFLPSVNDPYRPLPSTYFGVFRSGDIKARGIEVRQRKVPKLVKLFQQKVLEEMAGCDDKKDIVKSVPYFCSLLRDTMKRLKDAPAGLLSHKIRISTDNYKHNIPQKRIVAKLKRDGVRVLPGMSIEYVMQRTRPVLPAEYNGRPDLDYYRRLLVRSLFILLQPFGITRDYLVQESGSERQLKLTDFSDDKIIKVRCVPIRREYASTKGLSERYFRRVLEKQGWMVWRGGSVNMLDRDDLFPNVRRKYGRLLRLLCEHHADKVELLRYYCHVHHGMPDFICYRKGEFKFVECKFRHEQLSKRQKLCIQKLQALGFKVEVLKFVEASTRTIRAEINYSTKEKNVLEKQKPIFAFA